MHRSFILHLLCICLFFPAFFQAQTIYVNTNISGGNNDGSNWANAFQDLQDALVTSEYGTAIWVAQGTYYPTTSLNRDISFEIPNGVALYGGFLGDENELEARDWENHETILSGNIGVQNDSLDNSHTVVYMEYVDSTTILDGFSVMYGNANNDNPLDPSSGRDKNGGGLFLEGSGTMIDANPMIRNCKFAFNNSYFHGGGLYIIGSISGATSPYIDNCNIVNNKSLNGNGAGLFKKGGSFQAEAVLINSNISNNYAGGSGGGMYYENTHGTRKMNIHNCLFMKNVTNGAGAGIDQNKANSASNMEITHSIFKENVTTDIGSGINSLSWLGGSELIIEDCLFENNSSGWGGTVSIYGVDGENGHIQNCTFTNNVAGQGSCLDFINFNANVVGCIFANNMGNSFNVLADSDELEINLFNCLFFRNQTNSYSDLVDLITQDGGLIKAHFYNVIFQENTINNEGYFMQAYFGSEIKFSNCIFDVDACENIAASNVECLSDNFFNTIPFFKDTAELNFTLLPCSPGINAGTNFPLNNLNIPTDLAGNPRIQDGIVDIGPYEMMPIDFSAEVDTILPSCPNSNGGSFLFEFTNACEPITYEWNNGFMNGNGNTVLEIGTYTITVTDALGKNKSFLLHIPEATPSSLDLTTESFICGEGVGGTAAALPSGNNSGYTYLWNTGQTDSVLYNLGVGDYALTVTDGAGCTATATGNVSNSGNLSLGITVSAISCHDSEDGTAAVIPLDGFAPFDFLWADTQSDSLITNLSGGDYSVTVTDALGCAEVLDFSMEPPTELVLAITGTSGSCFQSGDGTALVSATGGTVPYNYVWSNFQTDSLAVNLEPGSYSVTVNDIKNCTKIISIEIETPSELSAELNWNAPTCHDTSDGSISIIPSGGTLPYTYHWGNGITDSLHSNLPQGDYEITITDANGCTEETMISLDAPPEFLLGVEIIPILCANEQGSISTIPIGGTPPYFYEWNTGSMDSFLVDLSSGEYAVTILDAHNCEENISVTFPAIAEISIDSLVVNATAPDSTNGAIVLTEIFGGTPNFSFEWSHGATSQSVNDLAPGIYDLTITDANSCEVVFSFVVDFVSGGTEIETENSINIFPNPIRKSDKFFLEFDENIANPIRLQLLDINGRIIWEKKTGMFTERQTIELSGPVISGIYFLDIIMENGERIILRLLVV